VYEKAYAAISYEFQIAIRNTVWNNVSYTYRQGWTVAKPD